MRNGLLVMGMGLLAGASLADAQPSQLDDAELDRVSGARSAFPLPELVVGVPFPLVPLPTSPVGGSDGDAPADSWNRPFVPYGQLEFQVCPPLCGWHVWITE